MTAIAWSVSVVRALVTRALVFAGVQPPLTPAHGWLLPAPVPLLVRVPAFPRRRGTKDNP
jgi:hypothetical protein